MKNRWIIWGLIVVAGIGCFLLNWTASNDATFSLSAVDLAEWASLHPQVRAGSPPLLVTLLLRVPAALIVCMVVIQLRRYGTRRTVLIGVGVIGAISLLPPWEFFSLYSNDPNYRQQAALAALTLASCAALSLFRREKLSIIEIGLALATGISTFVGLSTAQGLMRTSGIETGYGLGGITVLVASAATGITLCREQLRPTRK